MAPDVHVETNVNVAAAVAPHAAVVLVGGTAVTAGNNVTSVAALRDVAFA